MRANVQRFTMVACLQGKVNKRTRKPTTPATHSQECEAVGARSLIRGTSKQKIQLFPTLSIFLGTEKSSPLVFLADLSHQLPPRAILRCMEHTVTQRNHEDFYRKTIQNVTASVESGGFSPEFVPKLVMQLRTELGQCIELLLISPEFYGQQMEKLAKVLERSQ